MLGTAALRDPALVRYLAGSRRIAVGLDARAGEVATDGWLQGSGQSVLDVARSFASGGVDAFVVTDISRDGTLVGPDLDGLTSVLDAVSVDVIASGGVGRLDDLQALAGIESPGGRRLSGVIVGTALYERRFTVAEAVAALARDHQRQAEMRVARVIPCLDVDAGRVVKGVNFVDIRDAGDPVELGRPLRRRGRRRAGVPGHHRLVGPPRHHRGHGPGSGRRGVHPLHHRRRHPHPRRRPPPAASRG